MGMQRRLRKFLHRDELAALIAVKAPAHERLALDLFLDTGVRVSELVSANVSDLWLDDGERVQLSVSVKGRGRRAEKFPVSLDPALAGGLLESLGARRASPDAPLLVNAAGNRFARSSLSQLVARLARRAGITRLTVRAHALRHTFNVIARQAGVEVYTRSRLLNHSDTGTLSKYDHLDATELTDARDKIRDSLRRVREGRAPN